MMDISDPGSSAIGVYSTAFIPGFEGPGVEVHVHWHFVVMVIEATKLICNKFW